MKKSIESLVEFEIECLPEGGISIKGNCSATELHIVRELEMGNDWAWCTVKVTARIAGVRLEGTDYLGACSYKNEADFKESGYFKDMQAEALSDLKAQLNALISKLKAHNLI